MAGELALAGLRMTNARPSPAVKPPTTPDGALQRLLDGNARFVADETRNLGEDKARRLETAEQQTPFAIVVGCADSRVPPEILFDQGIGAIFTVRVAGNTTVEPAILGSIEFAVEQLGSLLVVVLGHERCGAVQAAVDHVLNRGSEHGSISAVVGPIIPAVEAVKDQPQDTILEAAVQQNARFQARAVASSAAIIRPLVDAGTLKVVAAEYHLATGRVEVLA